MHRRRLEKIEKVYERTAITEVPTKVMNVRSG
jgi:hypothetical protein